MLKTQRKKSSNPVLSPPVPTAPRSLSSAPEPTMPKSSPSRTTSQRWRLKFGSDQSDLSYSILLKPSYLEPSITTVTITFDVRSKVLSSWLKEPDAPWSLYGTLSKTRARQLSTVVQEALALLAQQGRG